MSNEIAKYIYDRAGLPPDLRGCDFSRNSVDDRGWQNASHVIRKNFRQKSGKIIILSGQNNTGKSVVLSCAAALASKSTTAVRYFAENDFIKRHKLTWRTDIPAPVFPFPALPYLAMVNGTYHRFGVTPKLLLWDELAYCSYRDEVTFFDIFNDAIDRINERNINVIFATNYSLTKLIERVGKRFWARIERRGLVWCDLKKKLV